MKNSNIFTDFIKGKLIALLLTFSIITMCIVHAIPAGIFADFFAINGDFQNFNVVRRFIDGQAAYGDFAAYLGYGHLFWGSILTLLFGGPNPSLAASKMAFQFAAIFSFVMIVYTIFRAVFYARGRILPLVMGNLLLLLLLLNPTVFVNAFSITGDFYSGMQASLVSGNSARFLRGSAPVFFVLMTALLSIVLRKIRFINKSESLYSSFVLGIPTGVIFYYSNDYGIASSVSIIFIFASMLFFAKIATFKKLNIFYTFITVTVTSFIVFGYIISRGHFNEYINATFCTGGSQSWYYLSAKSFYVWDIDLGFWTCVQALFVVYYFIILIRKEHSRTNIIRYGIPLFFNLTSYIAQNEYKLFSGNILHEVSYTVLYLTIVAESLFFVDRFIIQNKRISLSIKRITATFVALSGIAWSVSAYCPLLPSFTENRGRFVPNLGYFTNTGLARSIKSTDEFLSKNDKIFSTYASGLEAYRGIFQPSGIDYIIHVFGDKYRTEYLKSLQKMDSGYVATIREAYTGWEYWIKNANWFFYRELHRHYRPVYATDYQLFWTKNFSNQQNYSSSFYVESLDDHSVRISVYAPSISFGIADVNLNYKVGKKSGIKSFFTFNTMVLVNNESSFRMSGVDFDRVYYLAKSADGTSNNAIGIPIINGNGSVVLTSQPDQNTKFDSFTADLVGIYNGGFFKSVVVTSVQVDGERYHLTIANSPENRLITENAVGIRIYGEEYPASFSVNGSSIFIDTKSLGHQAAERLTGHTYFPVIEVIK